jgi:hypothetical protein
VGSPFVPSTSAVPETNFHNHKAGKVIQPMGLRGESEEHKLQSTGLASLAETIRERPLLLALRTTFSGRRSLSSVNSSMD